MANVSLNIIMGLVDKARPGLESTELKLRQLRGEARQVSEQFKASWEEVGRLSQQAGAGMMAAGVGFTAIAASSVQAAMEVEGYRAKLEVALKSSERAKEMLDWSKGFAAQTPFEMGEVVDATARLEMYGLTAKKWLPLTGDLAGAMGRDVTQAVEAVADAVSGGGLERLKEFGITSQKLLAHGWTGSYQTAEGINTLKKALEDIISSDYGGGMAKMMGTAKGAMSNLSDAAFQLRLAMGEALLPVVSDLTRWMTALLSGVAKLGNAHPLLTKLGVLGAAALGLLLVPLGSLLMVIPGAVQAWNLLTAAQTRNAAAAAEAAAANTAAGGAAAAGGAGAGAGAAAGGIRGLLGLLAGFGARALGLLAPAGAVIASAWGSVVPVFVAIGEALAAVGAAIAALPVGTILAIVAAVVALGIGIWQAVKNWDKIKAWFSGLGATLAQVPAVIGEALSGVGTTILGGLQSAWQAITGFFSQLPRNIGYYIGATVAIIMWLPTGMRLAAQSIGQGIVSIGAWFASLPGAVSAAAQSALQSVVTFGQSSLQAITSGLAAAIAWIGAGVKSVGEWIASLPERAYAAGAQFVASLAEWFSSLPGRIADWFEGVWTYLKGLPAEFYNAGVAMVQAIIDGIKSKWNELTAGFREGLQNMRDMLPHSEPKTGPLRGLGESGREMMRLLSAGVRSGSSGLLGALRDALAQAHSAIPAGMENNIYWRFSETPEGRAQSARHDAKTLNLLAEVWAGRGLQAAGAGAGAAGGTGGFVFSGTINVDARGATDPAAVRQAGYEGAQRALREATQNGLHGYGARE